MSTSPDYFEANKRKWDKATPFHVASDFYDVPAFLNGKSSLNNIELELLGNFTGKDILHLQCHFGQDTLSLARMGANTTGIDLSDAAIYQAQTFATQMGLEDKATFVCSNVYDLKENLHQQFDIVFSSYGVIGWLPDMTRWAEIVSHFLKPGGQFIFVEFHPAIWMFDDDFTTITYSYFNREVILDDSAGSYADKNADLHTPTYTWNHSLAEVITALLQAGLNLEQLQEFDYSPYNCFKNTMQIDNRYYIKGMENKLPMVYALKMSKRG
jgi:2-polyprenyl-3-methyl-5-hydroxy-6-metoxy-1,4-benzoquinol methylase